MTKPDLLHAANWTHAGDIRPSDGNYASPLDLRERVEACCLAGFSGMGFVFVDIENALVKYSVQDIGSIFADNGIEYLELEALMDWFEEGASIDDALRLCEAIGAKRVKAVGDVKGNTPISQLVESFATVCDQFNDLGAEVVIELMKITNLDTLEKGRAVVEGADRKNGGLLFDSWHVVRCGMDLEQISKLPRGLFRGIELCGVPKEPVVPDAYAEMVDCRLQPDEGAFSNADLLQAARTAGFDGPWGIEIVAEKHRDLPVNQAMQRSAEAMRNIWNS